MSTISSPRLPGVPILHANATGAEYSRWRRGIKFACESKGTWSFCDGSHPMPMPRSGSIPSSPRASNTSKPCLLDERKAWVRQDREVKLDIFLSVSEEVMEEALHAGPPLPPSNMNAQQMLAALDRRFKTFRFEDYHHALCHFLNLHLDAFASLEEFNAEFKTSLEDLHDYGQPLSNTQACSAYFSKLRCTQNPWVTKKLEEWDTQASVPKLEDLMRESIPWTFKPTSSKTSPRPQTESIPEELIDDTSSRSDTDSSLSAASSPSQLHSRQTSNTTAITTHSLEITIHASSSDIAQMASLPRLPATRYNPAAACHLSAKASMPPIGPLPPITRPLPPIPKHVLASPRARSASPRIMVPSPKVNIASPKGLAKTMTPKTPELRLETTHPTLRPKSPTLLDQKEFGPKPAPSPITPGETKIHPALRHIGSAAALETKTTASQTIATLRVTPPLASAPFEEENTPIPWPSTPDTAPREPYQKHAELDALTRLRAMSGASLSTTSLPIAGGRSLSPPRLQDRPLLATNTTVLSFAPSQASSPPLPSSPPKPLSARAATNESLVSLARSRTPTFESLGVPRCTSPGKDEGCKIERSRSPVRELVARLSGDSLEVKGEGKRERKKSWSLGVGLGRFGPGKGIKEIV
ncbi:hypothetical protein E8E12_001889 [Didymella heteroderae]|uniref:Uncharacterized protein n=1 Tax=Didymella heteroderae TaxID=1769908 RepID=A0A9P5C3Y4_9PLEO|nr:hypothetical protein E8E12_001889 [Didymella heteroderae]